MKTFRIHLMLLDQGSIIAYDVMKADSFMSQIKCFTLLAVLRWSV